jgi:hypothetical protein
MRLQGWPVGKGSGVRKGGEVFGIPLINASEAAELALNSVVIAVMVGAAGHEQVAADVVEGLHLFHDVNGEGQARDPGRTCQLVLHVKFRGGRVLDDGFRAEVVSDTHQKMGLLATHQVDIAHGPLRVGHERRRPDQAVGAIAEEIENAGRGDAFDRREVGEKASRAPSISGLVEIELDGAAGEVNQVDGSGSINVSEADATAVEEIGSVENRRVIHGDLGTEFSVTQIRPVADIAIADSYEVGKTIAAHVRQENGFRAVCKDEPGSQLFVQSLRQVLFVRKSQRGQRFIPAKGGAFANEKVGKAVPGEVNEFQFARCLGTSLC